MPANFNGLVTLSYTVVDGKGGSTAATQSFTVDDDGVGSIARVSVDSDGAQANNSSFNPSLSADGRYIAFYSNASNLVADDTNGTPDIFIVDGLEQGWWFI
jgi:hypothetical protein